MSSHNEHEPAPVANGAHLLEIDHRADAYDALADLFLGDQELREEGPFRFEASEETGADGAGEAFVEGIIVGHLPVLASAWVSQYARHRAQDLGRPVALLSARGGRVRIELFGDAPRAPAPFFEEAVEAVDQAGGAWIIRVDEPEEPRLAESRVNELTLLTGADQAAIVASYRVIKRLKGDSDRGGSPERVRIAAMGSNEDDAALIGDKIRRAASTFLGCEVEVAGVIQRIEPGRSTTLFDGPVGMSTEELVELVRGGVEAQTVQREPAPADRLEHGSVTIPADVAPRPVSPRGPADAPKVDASRVGLAHHVASLTPLPIVCPYADGVELARDREGRLHVLARGAGGEANAVGRLLVAARWATAHAPLLAAAHGPLDCRSPVLNLFSSDVASVRRLLDTDVRVHLLAPVEIDGHRGWYCTALN